MLAVVLGLLSLLLLIVTVLPLLHSEARWIRVLDFPRLQFGSLALFLLILEIAFLDRHNSLHWIIAAITLFALLYHLAWILPYTSLKQKEVLDATGKRGKSLRMIAANVLRNNRNFEGLLAMVREFQPHVLLTLETDNWWEERLKILESEYPYTAKCPRQNLYGMHLYSRLPLKGTEIEYLLKPDIPSIHTTICFDDGREVAAHFLHPRPPAPGEAKSSKSRDAELTIVAARVADNPGPVLVAGDLNDVAWSRTTRLFRKLSGLLDPRVGRGMFNTFHAEHWYLRWPLDHLFHSRHFRLGELRRLSYFGSDHFPLYSDLVLMDQADDDQRGLSLDEDDKALAQRKLRGLAISKHDVPREGESKESRPPPEP